MQNINFNTDNIVIVYYSKDSGGKFLINSLGLSDDAVFQSAELAEKQLNGMFTIDNKIQYLINELGNVQDTWNDLNLGCSQFFGINDFDYRSYTSDLIKQNTDIFNPVLEKISNKNLKFFVACHDFFYLEKLLSLWPNARIIFFENSENFINFRTGILDQIKLHWDTIRGVDWPETNPSSLSDLEKKCSSQVLEEITSQFPYIRSKIIRRTWQTEYNEGKLKTYKSHKVKNQKLFWDTDLYFSCEDTVNKIEQFYHKLELTNFNREYITTYYNLWINKLKELRQK
jgi:hypothetical protein